MNGSSDGIGKEELRCRRYPNRWIDHRAALADDLPFYASEIKGSDRDPAQPLEPQEIDHHPLPDVPRRGDLPSMLAG